MIKFLAYRSGLKRFNMSKLSECNFRMTKVLMKLCKLALHIALIY